jgi:hypothetical protein
VSNRGFRDLLDALNFEAMYDSTKRELTIRGALIPELTHPDGSRSPLSVAPQDSCGRACPTRSCRWPRCALRAPRRTHADARARPDPAGGRAARSVPPEGTERKGRIDPTTLIAVYLIS